MAEIDGERRAAVDDKLRLQVSLEDAHRRLSLLETDEESRRGTEEKLTLSEDEIHRLHKELETVEETMEEVEKANAKLKEDIQSQAEAFHQEEVVSKMKYEEAKDELEAEAANRMKGIESDLNKSQLTMAEVTKIINDTLHLANKTAAANAENSSSTASSKNGSGSGNQGKVNSLVQGLKAAKEAIETPPTDAYLDFSTVVIMQFAEKALQEGGGRGGDNVSLSEEEKLDSIRLQFSAEAAILSQMANHLKGGKCEWLNERQEVLRECVQVGKLAKDLKELMNSSEVENATSSIANLNQFEEMKSKISSNILLRNQLSELISQTCRRQLNASAAVASDAANSPTEESTCSSCDEAFLKSSVDQVFVRASRGDSASLIGKSLLQVHLQQTVELFAGDKKNINKAEPFSNSSAQTAASGDQSDDDNNNDRIIEAQLKKAAQILAAETESLTTELDRFVESQLHQLESKTFRIGVKEAATYLNNFVEKETQHLRRQARIHWCPSSVIRGSRQVFDLIHSKIDGVKSRLEERLTRVKKPLPSTAEKAAAAAEVQALIASTAAGVVLFCRVSKAMECIVQYVEGMNFSDQLTDEDKLKLLGSRLEGIAGVRINAAAFVGRAVGESSSASATAPSLVDAGKAAVLDLVSFTSSKSKEELASALIREAVSQADKMYALEKLQLHHEEELKHLKASFDEELDASRTTILCNREESAKMEVKQLQEKFEMETDLLSQKVGLLVCNCLRV